MAGPAQTTSVTHLIAIKIDKCSHFDGCSVIKVVHSQTTIKSLFIDLHGERENVRLEAKCSTDVRPDSELYEIDPDLTIGDLKGFYPVKSLKLQCVTATPDETSSTKGVPIATTLNAFNILLAGTKVHPVKKTCHNRKDELYNDVVEMCVSRDLKLHKSAVKDEGSYIIQVLTNALWYITNQHQTINDTSLRFKDVVPVPEPFEKFQGYNEFKRKKLKAQPLTQDGLHSHSEALFSLLNRPIFSSSWFEFKADVETLATCLCRYKEYLQKQLTSQSERQSADHPPRTVGSDISIEHRAKSVFVKEKYLVFDQAVAQCPDTNVPIFFDEKTHLSTPFQKNQQRARFFAEMSLSVDIDLYKYCPGGSSVSVVFVAKTIKNRSSEESLVDPIRVVSQVQNKLPEFHTRYQKRYFKQKLSNIATLKPSVVDFIYKELALDASQVSNPEMEQRLRLIALGETGLIADLRDMNFGRPSDKFDDFFTVLNEVVESYTAVDDRRHSGLHLSQWINLEEMIVEAADKCPEGTLVPSKSLVRLQFQPRNPYAHAALNFTSKIPVQYKIQRRQLRLAHQDQHFCAAMYKYMKSKAIELGKYGMLVCSDDKAKVPVGNPGLPISTGVRGKQTITPASMENVAADHDMHCSSLTPSVYLVNDVPDSTDKSFVSGTVHVVVNDSVFQTSSAFRHSALLTKVLSQGPTPKVLLRYTDGGTDQRNNLVSVQCANIGLFSKLDLDMLILARCAPGNSWCNPAERIMSILNLGLQNCALERADDDGVFKSCSSMNSIRELVGKKPELKDKWVSSVEPIQRVVQNRFSRLSLKGNSFKVEDPVSDDDIDLFKRHLAGMFPDLDLSKLQKKHTQSVESFQTWLDQHTRQRQYSFQIRKCGDPACCTAVSTPQELLEWLPDPVFRDESKEHYKSYAEVKGQDTNDHDRPSYTAPTAKGKCNVVGVTALKKNSATAFSKTDVDASIFTAQNARYSVECVECTKPRVLYAKSKLTERQQMQLITLLSEDEYTCGSFITVPNSSLHNKVHVRLGITCETSVELAFYRSDFAKADLCCFCASDNAKVDAELKKRFKTVLPTCETCIEKGLEPIHARPFGAKK
ncbi:hypothetical protein MAR_029658 [Mya arenaria]|uniref:Uncharacterized protein n=1 Tax=Mya arenaria TaxID=6604 RepID=A0ABY7DJ76_MYAAR|nr:hypothetical protein MAR_029658 [Mya arenaria]